MKNTVKKAFLPLFLLFVLLTSFSFISHKFVPVKSRDIAATKTVLTASVNNNNNSTFIYDSLQLQDLGLSKQAFDEGVKGFKYLLSQGKLSNDHILSIADFSLPSSQKRLFVIDLQNFKLLFNTYVAHGRKSGKEYATQFSNSPQSNMSSLGFYVTKQPYLGEHGLSLKLQGEEKGINDNAESRAIVIHCADYVSEKTIKVLGYIGRSLGCPALPEKYIKPIIETIKDGSCFFVYSPSKKYFSRSEILQQAS